MTLLTGCSDVAEIIHKLYQDDFLETSREWYVLDHNPYQISFGIHHVQTKVGCVDTKNFWSYMKPRLYFLEDIKMIGHPHFISKTTRNLSDIGCKGVFNTLLLGCPPSRDEDYNREIDILINEEKIHISLFEKLTILKRIQAFAKEYCQKHNMDASWFINEIMYNHYLEYIYPRDLYITGYLIDPTDKIYGV